MHCDEDQQNTRTIVVSKAQTPMKLKTCAELDILEIESFNQDFQVETGTRSDQMAYCQTVQRSISKAQFFDHKSHLTVIFKLFDCEFCLTESCLKIKISFLIVGCFFDCEFSLAVTSWCTVGIRTIIFVYVLYCMDLTTSPTFGSCSKIISFLKVGSFF